MHDTDSKAALPLTPDGTWCQVLRRPAEKRSSRPALFLDRDGVVVEERHYLHTPDEVALVPGAAEVIRRANLGGFPVVVVTNQSGIGRGYFTWPDFAATQERILGDLAAEGAFIDAVLACPFHDSGEPPYDRTNHPWRKPNPGMLATASDLLGIACPRSWIVGDHATDVGAGRNAGLEGAVHVATGHGLHAGQRERALAHGTESFKVLACPSIREAAELIPFLNRKPDGR